MTNITSMSAKRRFLPVLVACVAVSAASCTSGSKSQATSLPGSPAPSAVGDGGSYGPGWSAVHADGTNSNYSRVEAPARLTPAWQRDLHGPVQFNGIDWAINLGATSGRHGLVYLTSSVDGCHFMALDVSTGATRWCAGGVGLSAIGSSGLVDTEGRVFIGDGQYMRAFNSAGTELWKQPIIGVPFSAQFTPAGRLLFITNVGVIYVLDRKKGKEVVAPLDLVPDPKWSPSDRAWACARGTKECPSANTPALDSATGDIYFTFWAPGAPKAGVRAVHLTESAKHTTLTPLWSNDDLTGGSASSPALSRDGRHVYVTDNVNTLYALNASTGRLAWSRNIGFAAGGGVSVSPQGLIIPPGGPLLAIADVGSSSRVAWHDDDLRNRGIATQSAGDHVYATVRSQGAQNDLVVVDSRTGAVLDRASLPGATLFSVGITVASDGTVLVPMIGGQLFAFRHR